AQTWPQFITIRLMTGIIPVWWFVVVPRWRGGGGLFERLVHYQSCWEVGLQKAEEVTTDATRRHGN
ncbi:hypothetical protein J6590_028314, partial [Homalodisca vitripennis]